MSDLNIVFALYHIYDKNIGDVIIKESKRIGFFETKQQCIHIINTYKNFKGFKDYPDECFKIFKYQVGEGYWRKEFLP